MRFKREMKGPPTGKELDKAMTCHTLYGMKMTMHIDEALLRRVMESYGYDSKTEAVEMALRELDRKARFREVGLRGMEMTAEELAEAVDPAYDLDAMRVAETPSKYGK
jgi:Arc/MetJ family transcription regulator